jgi:hypothetical protein
MNVHRSVLLEELQRLRKGRGVYHPSGQERFGSHIRAVCGAVGPDAPLTLLRSMFSRSVDDLLGDEGGARMLLRAASGLAPEGRLDEFSTYGKRVSWLASKLHVGERTVEKRVDRALIQYVDAAIAVFSRISAADADPGFVIDAFRVDLSFIGDRPRVLEERKIRCACEQLDVVRIRFGILSPPSGNGHERPFEIEVREGGSLTRVDSWSSMVAYEIKLTQPLVRGQMHKLVSRLVPARGQPLAPHYVVQPITSVESFTINAHFDQHKRPVRVRRVNRAPHGEIDISFPGDEVLELDAGGKVETTFLRIRDSRSYGLAWTWGDC